MPASPSVRSAKRLRSSCSFRSMSVMAANSVLSGGSALMGARVAASSTRVNLDRFQKEKAWTRPKPFLAVQNPHRRKVLAPLLLASFLGLLLWFCFCLRFWLGFFGFCRSFLFCRRLLCWFRRRLGRSFGRWLRHRLLFSDEDLFLFRLHDLLTAA